MSTKKDLTFEAAIMSLEDSISKMENGALTLDESIEEFEKALGMIKLCESKLTAAKERVRILTSTKDGSITDMPFNEEQ